MPKQFTAIMNNMQIGGTVILNSPGGNLENAAAIGRLVRARFFSTSIPRRAVCYSGCVVIWLAGDRRELDPRSLIGVHSARKDNGATNERSEEGNAFMADFMLEVGAPKDFIDLALKADPQKMTYLNYEMVKAWGLLTERHLPR